MTDKQTLSRRDFLRLAGGAAAGVTLANLPGVTASEPQAKPQPQEVQMTFWAPNCDVQCEHIKLPEWLERYREEVNPNVSFELSGPPWGEYWTRLPLALAGGTGPDLYYFHTAWLTQFVDGGLVEPWPEARIETLREQVDGIDTLMIEDKLYTLALERNFPLIYYNTEMWEEAGLTEDDIPKSWADVTEVAKTLTIKDSSGTMTRAGWDGNLRDGRWTWVVLKYQLGEFMFSEPDEYRRVHAYTERAQEALQIMWDWEFSDDPIGNIDLAPWVEDSIPTGIAAMGFGFGWFADYWRSDYPEFETWDTFPLPTIGGETPPAAAHTGGEVAYSVNSQTTDEKKDVGFDFVQWSVLDPEVAKFKAVTGFPNLRSIQADPDILANPVIKAMEPHIDRTIFFGVPPSGWEDGMAQVSDLFIAQTATIDESLQNTQSMVDDVLMQSESVYWGFQERAYKHADELSDSEILG